ncbi:cytochrome b/b6 domain-containing protein [Methylobacillus caricis]|uniref:cytochrome b/b6 domain-containing protein n=1 Tax=Methylobacillus caricis TaxID=1971611 RepID=UPI001CFFDEB7|nr:cytochrome b/b6 domain-containing protein [Methylobacillus caricis]MCB5188138.1 cytochrome b/b6 domain-containing protein [Methylobacillus caricis]
MKHINTWDLPLRIFHWSLVALFTTAIITVKIGGNALEWHVISGLALLALLIFRVLWGFAGGTYAKFSNFIRGPRAIVGYLKGTGDKTIGHNPLGGWSVVAMLLLLLAQAITGLFANDDIFTEGPLYSLIDKDTSDYLTYLHTVNQYVLYGLIGLHIAAILYYRLFKHENLVKAMITGRKQVPQSLPDTHASQGGHVILGSVLLAASAGIVWFIATHWA